MAVSHIFTSPVADATGTVTIWNGATTATVAASDIVRPSDWNSVHNQFMTLGGNTAGQSTVSGTNIVFAGGNNVTISANGQTVSFVGPTAAGTGFTSTTTAGTAIVGTLGTDGLSVGVPAFVTTFDATSGRAGTGFATTTSNGGVMAGTMNTNGLTLGVPAFLTTARGSTDAIGLNTALTAGPLAWTVNSSGLSLNAGSAAGTTSGFTGGASISGSMTHNTAGLAISLSHPAWITTARASTDGIGLNSAFTAGPLAMTINSSGLSLNASSAAGTTSGFAGNLISGSMTHNTAGLNLSLNHPAWLTTARGSTDAIGLNTAQTNVTWTVNSSGLSLDARGYAGTGTTFAGANVSGSMTVNSVGVNLSLSAGAGGTINQTGPNIAAGTQTGTSGTIVFSNSNGVTFGMSNSSVVTASVANPMATYVPYWPASTSTQTYGGLGTTSASAFVYPIQIYQDITFNHLKFMYSASLATGTGSANQNIRSMFGIFTNNAGTLSALSTGSFSLALTVTSVSGTISFPSSTNSAGYTYGTTTWTTTAQGQSFVGTGQNRVADLVFGGNMTLTPGLYWLGVMQTQGTTNTSIGLSTGMVGVVMNSTSNMGYMGQAFSNVSTLTALHLGAHGVYSSTGSAGYGGTTLPTSMFLTGFSNSLQMMPLLTFMST